MLGVELARLPENVRDDAMHAAVNNATTYGRVKPTLTTRWPTGSRSVAHTLSSGSHSRLSTTHRPIARPVLPRWPAACAEK
ncbi:hypothetical protein BA763_04885 [Burkholderia cenocepacia]|nr:hypothetical protein BA763_04885 [Burkholderia cenocepacia]